MSILISGFVVFIKREITILILLRKLKNIQLFIEIHNKLAPDFFV